MAELPRERKAMEIHAKKIARSLHLENDVHKYINNNRSSYTLSFFLRNLFFVVDLTLLFLVYTHERRRMILKLVLRKPTGK